MGKRISTEQRCLELKTMLRLLLSLYFVTVVGLISINWASEFIWQSISPKANELSSETKSLIEPIKYLVDKKSDLQLKALNQQLQINIEIKDKKHYALLDEHYKLLSLGIPVVLYDDHTREILTLTKDSKQFIVITELKEEASGNNIYRLLLLGSSYIVLGLFLAIWIQPVWRDLKYLEFVSEKVKNNDFELPAYQKYRSPISKIVQTTHEMTNRITALLSEQKQLINAVSHELRTPLSRLHFSIAMEDSLDEKQKGEITQDVTEIEGLVDEMLAYARLEYLSHSLKRENIDVYALLSSQVDKLKRNTSKEINFSFDGPNQFSCQPDLLERASQNLITNAIKYSNEHIEVSLSVNEHQLKLTVEDDGPGVADESVNIIFRPFTRVDKSRNKGVTGYGLGLAIVKKAVDWHQGRCDVSSSSLGGAKFTLTID